MFIRLGPPTMAPGNNRVALRRRAYAGASGALIALLLTLLGASLLANREGPAVAATLAPTSCYEWSVVQSPEPTEFVDLNGVAAISADDVWAVGYYLSASIVATPLTEHWDGTRWSVVLAPNAGRGTSLFGVAAVSSNDVWAVGYYDATPVTEHWNGSEWSIIPSPYIGTYGSRLVAVAAISSSNVWAVGNLVNAGNVAQTLIEHWNGSAWIVVPSPNVGMSDNNLYGIAAVSSNDVWAVGSSGIYSSGLHTLIEHWNGSVWNVVTHPDLMGVLNAVAAVSSNDVWAVGDYSTGGLAQTLIEHWDERAWSIVPSPAAPPIPTLNAIAVVSSRDVWAVGESYYYCNGCTFHPLIEHWNGTEWSIVPSPTIDSFDFLRGVAALSGRDIWAVGYYIDSDSGKNQALVQQYNTCLPATSTPTITPTPQPPPCPGERFTDVCPGDYFYTATLTLVRDDIVSGYYTSPPCKNSLWIPCFKPNSNITRGQIAKVASLAAGFNEPVNGQTFFDVPPNSTFYEYVERMAERGIIGGYRCGVPGEPCIPPLDRPYFFPNNSVSRGQLSKMVALAFQWDGPPSGQTFEDVPPGSAFYTYTVELYNRDIIIGYPCGGPGEPCNPPANRPYFRPSYNVLRGQTAKIVQLARTQPTPTPTSTATLTSTSTVTATSTLAAILTAVATMTATSVPTSTAPVSTDTPAPNITSTAIAKDTSTSMSR